MTEEPQVEPTPANVVQINVHIGAKDENVIMAFDERISWLEMKPVIAIQVAELMKEKAIEILRSDPRL